MLPLLKRKKAVSEIVSYSLLMIILVSLAVLVFVFLKLYVPKYQIPECPNDVNIVITDASCVGDKLSFEISNRGLFTIDAVYVRLHPPGKEIKSIVNPDEELWDVPIKPGETIGTDTLLTLNGAVEGDHTLNIQPAIRNEKNQLAVCENAIVTKVITCTA